MEDDRALFEEEKIENAESMSKNQEIVRMGVDFIDKTAPYKYCYNFSWLGLPIIQFPQDILAMQEIIWKIKPDLIIETGIARGGSMILYASILELIGKGEVLGVEIHLEKHHKKAIEEHPLSHRIKMIEGSSTAPEVIDQIKEIVKDKKKVLVFLDSHHTHDHVLEELKLYSPFITKGSYLVAFDTVVEDLPADFVKNRPWGKGNNPKTAVKEFLKDNDEFKVDKDLENKLVITVAPGGYLKKVK